VRALLLGGTGEARRLAAELDRRGIAFVSSLAGRVSNPALPVGEVRVGGFGAADGLAAYLRDEAITHLLDATHPFAATITANAAKASAQVGVPLIALRRPGWTQRPDDDWTRVADVAAAAAAVATSGPGTVFLTTGRRDLDAFAGDGQHHYLVRTVDPPASAMPPRVTLLLDRGPYTLDGERALMTANGITVLVTKDSGGTMTSAKLDAARELGRPVVMVNRPPLPPGVTPFATVDEVLAQLGVG
jgi:precorrin-6A/cobalt-precorrin-6A reductase